MRQERVKIGPAEAAALLEKNAGNRPVRKRRVVDYADAMREGKWRYNNVDAAIAVSREGALINGQHRLLAVVESGTTQEFDIVRDADPELFALLDRPAIRDQSDALAVRGEKQPHRLAAALKWIEIERQSREVAERGGSYRLFVKRSIEPTRILEVLEENPGIRDSIWVYDKITPKVLIPPSIAVWLHYRFSRVDKEWANQYFIDVGRGESLAPNSAELVVRNWLLRAMASNRHAPPELVAAILIKGWNNSLRMKPTKIIHWDPNKEGFPYVEGE